MKTHLLIALLLTSVALAGCATPTDDAPPTTDDSADPEPQATAHERILTKAHEIAADLNTPEKAFAAGYRPAPVCVPGMGVHWIHKPGEADSYFDTTLDEDHPEVLLFLPDDANLSDTTGDQFLGIEYVVITEGTDMNSTDALPTLYGEPLHGPMAGHEPGMPWHAELHVYLADGLESNATFPDFRDEIVCPGETGDDHAHDHGDAPDAAAEDHAAILAKAHEVAEALDTPEEAFAAGYRPDPVCVPGMGVHWIHKPGEADSYFDTTLDEDHPEVLLFLPDDGNLTNTTGDQFLGIEYVVVTEGTEMNSTESVPRLYNVPLRGPMAGHTPEMPWHAELHVYLADGLESDATFPDFRDEIECPSSSDDGEA